LTHSQATSDYYGDFKHPFLNVSSEVQTIYYEKSGTFSTKLHRVERVRETSSDGLASSRWTNRKQGDKLKRLRGAALTTPLKNFNEFYYLG